MKKYKIASMRKISRSICCIIILAILLCGCYNKEEPLNFDTIRNAPVAKLETSDNNILYVDSEIDILKSFADLEIHEAPFAPTDNEDDWIYRITFNPPEKVSGSHEVVVAFHDSYVQINTEFYLSNEGVEYGSIMNWARSKFDYFFE